jgi:hypothetical protein
VSPVGYTNGKLLFCIIVVGLKTGGCCCEGAICGSVRCSRVSEQLNRPFLVGYERCALTPVGFYVIYVLCGRGVFRKRPKMHKTVDADGVAFDACGAESSNQLLLLNMTVVGFTL